MKSYAHLLSAVARTPWAIVPEKMTELLSVLAYRAAGGVLTAEEIRARIGDGGGGPSRQQGQGVAIVPIRGVIAHRMGTMEKSSGGTSCEGIASMLRAAAADPNVGSIVLDVDSPGGTVTGVQELAAEITDIRGRGTQTITAIANGMMCSAAYWLASQADEIVSIPSGLVGSIGVFAVHEDISAALEQAGVKMTLMSAGKYKVAANPFEPLSDEERAVIQSRVDEFYAQFVKDVARGRGVTPAAVRGGYGEGRALAAKDAKAAGLIDRIGTVDSVISTLAGSSSSRVRAETEPVPIAAGPMDVAADRYRSWR